MLTSFGPWDPESRTALVCGGGPAGLLCAKILRKHGYKVHIFERRMDPSKASPQRAWPLGLEERASSALQAGNIDLQSSPNVRHLTGAAMHTKARVPIRRQFEGSFVAVDRNVLVDMLLASTEGVFFGVSFGGLSADESTVQFEGDNLPEGGPWALLVAADGESSAVRESLVLSQGFVRRQLRNDKQYCQLVFPPQAVKDLGLDNEIIHVWSTGADFQAIIVPEADGGMAGVLVLPRDGEATFERFQGCEAAVFCQTIERVLPGFLSNADMAYGGRSAEKAGLYGHLQIVQKFAAGSSTWCDKFHSARGHVLLIGDAAHSMLATLGQGCNTALEDCRILDELLKKDSRASTLAARFTRERKEDADAIVDMSAAGFPRGWGFYWFIAQSIVARVAWKMLPGFPAPSRQVMQSGGRFAAVKRRRQFESNLLACAVGTALLAPAAAALARSGHRAVAVGAWGAVAASVLRVFAVGW